MQIEFFVAIRTGTLPYTTPSHASPRPSPQTYLLIDSHGNFGSIDADPATAMRHTECRLSKITSKTLLDNINLDTVNVKFLPNFDRSEYEPSVLPAKVPVLLLNGGAGISVGMATNVPPHNPTELMDACVALTERRNNGGKEVNDAAPMRIIPTPDFPKEACIIGRSGPRKLYTTARRRSATR